MRSLSAPPDMLSSPGPPSRTSRSRPPRSRSLPSRPSMRSRERVPISVSSPGVPRISARPGCTTIPRGVEPGSRTVSSRRRENGLTSVSVPLARLAKNSRLASGVHAGVPSPLPPAASRRTRRPRSTTRAPLRPPRRATDGQPRAPGRQREVAARAARQPDAAPRRGAGRRAGSSAGCRARTRSCRPSGVTATPVAPGTATRRSSRRARGSTIATRPRLSTTAARRPSRPSATADAATAAARPIRRAPACSPAAPAGARPGRRRAGSRRATRPGP